MGGQVRSLEGLFEAQESEPVESQQLGEVVPATELGQCGGSGATGVGWHGRLRSICGPGAVRGFGQLRLVDRVVRAVGVRLDQQLGKGRDDPGHRFHIPPGTDLELHPPVALADEGAHRLDQLIGGVGLADHRPDLHLTSLDSEHRGQGATLGTKVDVGHRHLEGRERQRGMGRSLTDLLQLGGRWQAVAVTVTVARYRGQGGHQDVSEDGQRSLGVLGIEGGVGQSRTLAPALDCGYRPAVRSGHVADEVDKDDRPGSVGTACRSYGVPERELHRPQRNGVQGDSDGASDRRPPYGQLVVLGDWLHMTNLLSTRASQGGHRVPPSGRTARR